MDRNRRYYFTTTPVKDLMHRRIQEVLLVCSKYDNFMLEEDGRVDEQIFQEYTELKLRYPPKFSQVDSEAGALQKLEEHDYDLVISMLNIGGPRALYFAESVRTRYPELPVVVLTPFSREVSLRLRNEELLDRYHIFAWLGDDSILLAIVKFLEDRMNVAADVVSAGVQAIILVEDSVRYYSSFLPAMYRVLISQARSIMEEGLNDWEQTMRMRCRPKILMATTFEEAMALYNRYRNNLLGVISDVSFRREGREDSRAGLVLSRYIREDNPDLPILLQSSEVSHRKGASAIGADFLHKHSETLIPDLAGYIRQNYGFGELELKNPKTGEEIARVSDLQDLQIQLESLPNPSFYHHFRNGEVIKWLRARAFFPLADVIEQEVVSLTDPEEAKLTAYDIIVAFRRFQSQGTIAQFNRYRYDELHTFSRIGDGSLGGKARGLAFMDQVLKASHLRYKYPGIIISVPRTVVLSTDVFQEFIERNSLHEHLDPEMNDREVLDLFVKGVFTRDHEEDLRAVLRVNTKPLAVRSSSQLEDSSFQPFAGVYSTYILPNGSGTEGERLDDLITAIKCVYASIFFKATRDYMEATGNLVNEEKMGVIIQELVGTCHGPRCYPSISGVARSLNFYPVENEKPEDGIAHIAVGLGKMVVDGGSVLRFSPRYPKKILQLGDPDTALKSSQKQFFALNRDVKRFQETTDEGAQLMLEDISVAAEDPSFPLLVSTWDHENGSLRDGYYEGGVPVPTFAGILKHRLFPLADILNDLLAVAQKEISVPVEIEFAVDLNPALGNSKIFSFLQVRPVIEGLEAEDIEFDSTDIARSLIVSRNALGNGVYDDLFDLVYIRPETFDPAGTEKIAQRLETINGTHVEEGRHYVLVVPGRLGSRDSWLGIPCKWSQISHARVIVEVALDSFKVDPSQGSHFFHNITSLHVAYLTVNTFRSEGEVVDFAYLDGRPAIYEDEFLRHLRFPVPLPTKIAGKSRTGIVVKPK